MKNIYTLFIDNDHHFGEFEMTVRGVLKLREDSPNFEKQSKALLKNAGAEVALVETDGTVVAVDLIITTVYRHGRSLTVDVEEKHKLVERTAYRGGEI